jgi:hypothetical protein
MQKELKKEFVPYNEALSLKKLGFDYLCFSLVTESNKFYGLDLSDFDYLEDNQYTRCYNGENCITTPTYSQSFCWFRENYKIMYTVNYNNNDKWFGCFTKIGGDYSSDFTENFETFEEAQLASLNKLIELCKQNQYPNN